MTTGLQSDPPRLKKGPKFFRVWSDALCDWMRETQAIPGLGMTVNQTPAGRLLNASGGGGAGSSTTHVPFRVIDATEGATKQVRIVLGLLKSDGVAWVPTGMFLGDVTPLIMPIVGTSGVVYLKVTVDANGDTTAVTIHVAASQPADSTTAGHLTLGTYGEDGEGVLSVSSEDVGSQAHIFCGIEHHFAKA